MNKKGKIYVIESNTDGAGKQTQTEELYNYLKEIGGKVVKFSFPNYNSYSSYFVKKYLNGEIGENAEEINPYIASTFFAIDRYITYKEEISKYYKEGYTILLDRYVSSNIVYQTSKIEEKTEKDKFIKWNKELEYEKYGLPEPDEVIFLYVDLDTSKKLRRNREKKVDGRDIHEENEEFLYRVSENAKYVSEKEKWIEINCVKNDKLRSVDDIAKEIRKKIKI